MTEMGRTSSAYGAIKKRTQNLLGKPDGKRSSGRQRRRREDNIKMDLREVGCNPGEWIDFAEDRDQ